MGSPGTFGLSFQQAEKIRKLMTSSGTAGEEGKAPAAPKSSPAQRFLAGLLANRDWAELISGPEWRTAAKILTAMVATARVNATQRQLGDWMNREGLVGDTALIRLGNQLMVQLDESLPERDAIGFELSSYALRRTVDELYGEGRSAFDVDRKDLQKQLPKVDTDRALRTYIASYFQELMSHVTGGLPPPATSSEAKTDSRFLSMRQEQVPRLAQEFLSTLSEYSKEKYGRVRPVAELLNDVPEWLSAASRALLKEGKK